jgi:hypothetical protein
MHQLDYSYNQENNRLSNIISGVTTTIPSSSYGYDAIGNLINDSGEAISISWNNAGKLAQVYNNNRKFKVSYGPTGWRQRKTVSIGNYLYSDYYLHDATGNIMAIYRNTNDTLKLIEKPIYGSSRLGMVKQNITLLNGGIVFKKDTFSVGLKNYELTDHLGNVTVTFLDRKYGNFNITSLSDYYPFGFPMPDRSDNLFGYRFGFNGQESDNEVYGGKASYTAEFWQYDSRLGRRWNIDPMQHPTKSPFSAFADNPIFRIDPTGMVDGDYYNYDGKYLGSDNINDNKVYVATGTTEKENEDGTKTTTFDNAIDLEITHKEFQTIANIVKQEGSTDEAKEYLWIAHTANNAASAGGSSLYQKLMSSYSSVSKSKKTELSTSNTNKIANFARAGVISVFVGNADPTGGARFWDGTDFLAWGLKSPDGTPQNKFEEYKSISISDIIYNNYLNSNLSTYKSGKVVYYGTSYSIPADVFLDNANWKNGNYFYKTGAKRTFGIEATGAAGRSIFWKIVN